MAKIVCGIGDDLYQVAFFRSDPLVQRRHHPPVSRLIKSLTRMEHQVDISDLDLSGNITVGDSIARSGFSEVFRGTLISGDISEVAIKVLRIQGHEINDESIERLRKVISRYLLRS
ncbi:hypothetical protein FRC02_003002 [Tulasnella sp. 418]|nr:hypothetical protein FRC02_003002 [Tulasnella sp. 418]